MLLYILLFVNKNCLQDVENRKTKYNKISRLLFKLYILILFYICISYQGNTHFASMIGFFC